MLERLLQVEFVDLCLFLQVFPYGSVPLKTYLPDGDIDLTALSCPNIEDALVSDVHAVLRGEEHNEAARFEVRDVHCIDAEVPPSLSAFVFFESKFFLGGFAHMSLCMWAGIFMRCYLILLKLKFFVRRRCYLHG